MRSTLQKRIAALEARASVASVGGCDPRRRLAKYNAWFSGRPWSCPKPTPENEMKRAEKLARYREYFDSLGG